jgi:hypothetical protein
MKKVISIIVSTLICGALYTSCSSDEQQSGNMDEPIRGITEKSQSEITDEPQGEIIYPKYGKNGLNILADNFVEATPTTGSTLVEYSMSADLSAGNSNLKIVIRSIIETETGFIEWGGYYPHSLDNWSASSWDNKLKGNTFTIYESGKPAHATVTFVSDCIVEYYENGATEPTKVKEIKVKQGGITDEPQDETKEDLQGVITYPKYGKNGLNILADDFVEATLTGDRVVEYSMSADLSAGNSSLKIVIRSIIETETGFIEWGGYYPHSLDNWSASSWDNKLKGNTFTIYESEKSAHATVTFVSDCIIEFYENGATEPTKVKEIKVRR